MVKRLVLVTLVYVLPAVSVTPEIDALPELHTPAITTIRLPLAMFDPGVSWSVAPVVLRPVTRWMKRGAAFGVTAVDCADSGPVPTALVAETVNVYVDPLTRPGTTADVGAGDPLTVVVGCAVPLRYGLIV